MTSNERKVTGAIYRVDARLISRDAPDFEQQLHEAVRKHAQQPPRSSGITASRVYPAARDCPLRCPLSDSRASGNQAGPRRRIRSLLDRDLHRRPVIARENEITSREHHGRPVRGI